MTEEEYKKTFAEWCRDVKGHKNIVLTKEGDWTYHEGVKEIRDKCKELYWDEWMCLRKDFCARKKEYQITNALESIKRNGIVCKLNNWQNGCITALSKHGRTLTYYATTGTIAGYGETSVKGLEMFIALCKK